MFVKQNREILPLIIFHLLGGKIGVERVSSLLMYWIYARKLSRIMQRWTRQREVKRIGGYRHLSYFIN